MDKLGVSGREGLGVVMRQSYNGLNYSLTDRDNLPNPVSYCENIAQRSDQAIPHYTLSTENDSIEKILFIRGSY